MLRFSRKALLALEAVLDVACHARPDPVQAREITVRQGVPHRYLEQVMQALVRADILRGVRGPHGGYRLARERRRITLTEIVAAVDGLEQMHSHAHRFSSLGANCLAPLCQKLEAGAMRELSRLTLADLCAQCGNAEPPTDQTTPHPSSSPDFTI